MTDKQAPEQQAKTWEPGYARLSPDQAREKITSLSAFIERYRTEYDPEEARRLGLGQSAFCYRNLDDKALAAFEAALHEPVREQAAPELLNKVCKTCHLDKLLSDYYDRTRSKDGKHHSCKACMRVRARGDLRPLDA